MKKLIIIGITLLVLIVFFTISTFSNSFEGGQSNATKVNTDGFGLKASAQDINDRENGANDALNKNIETNNEVVNFNQATLEMNFSTNGGRPTIKFEEIRLLAENDTVAATGMINQMIDNPEKNILELSTLTKNCVGLESPDNLVPLDEILNNQPFPKALWDTGYCSRIGTENDPFYTHLELARQGNKLAQLTLNEEFYWALERKTINPRLYPIEYNDLKNEVIGYLKSLSSQGVALASLKLGNQYRTNQALLPEDLVLAYFYSYLYEKQLKGSVRKHPWYCPSYALYCSKSPAELYQSLSKSDQARADRILERVRH
ncbi:hypothetical protein MNBD_GAMMA02-1320 [hydrothermal vent metagenome]|uniref:Uncharacterized protein n=1 Tax=hydrothermal vent metagenome TaxID=652676 RepID=A0A3B0WAU9_9ZZZZ